MPKLAQREGPLLQNTSGMIKSFVFRMDMAVIITSGKLSTSLDGICSEDTGFFYLKFEYI